MSSYEENYLSKRPQELCKMCGKCCRLSTTPKTYDELKKLAQEGDEGAIDFLDIFVPYDSIDEARKCDSATVDNIINMLSIDGNYNPEKITFYHCKYIQPDNLCGRYLERKTLCKHFPSSPWAIVPPGCGFEGWLFMKREEIKQNVRKEKEELVELQLLKTRVNDENTLKRMNLVEEKLKRNINLYKKYGSENW